MMCGQFSLTAEYQTITWDWKYFTDACAQKTCILHFPHIN